MTGTFHSNAISCGGCVNNIRARISKRPGVRSVSGDPTTKLVTIDFDEQTTKPEELATALAAAGYPVDQAK